MWVWQQELHLNWFIISSKCFFFPACVMFGDSIDIGLGIDVQISPILFFTSNFFFFFSSLKLVKSLQAVLEWSSNTEGLWVCQLLQIKLEHCSCFHLWFLQRMFPLHVLVSSDSSASTASDLFFLSMWKSNFLVKTYWFSLSKLIYWNIHNLKFWPLYVIICQSSNSFNIYN